ncbi:hypothetical protein BS17DRAFT_780712 [Gyrodon lividus]|nr:hypothetical protein BS17DRAFT_780712 [Gyrodon lividus]
MSGNNPFRAQEKSPETASPAPNSRRSSSPPLPPLPPSSPTTMTRSSTAISSPSVTPAVVSSNVTGAVTTSTAAETKHIDEDLPPAYTSAADPTIGEATIELGPRRPFQEPLRNPPSSSSGSGFHPQQQPQWHQPPGQRYHPQSQSSWHPQPQPNQAPWQTQWYPNSYGGQRPGAGGLLGALFDTVRDVVDVVSGAHEERMTAAQRANAGTYATPYNRSGAVAPYAPPAGVRRSSTPPRSPPPIIPDDGTPTRTPVPGHPLLRDGNLIVYPKDHLCVKCRNTGYKNYDPGQPCRKCWEKYGKPYTGALAYTSWASSGNDPRMQRALPKFVPPQLAGLGPSPSPGFPSRGLQRHEFPSTVQHSRSVSQPHFPIHPQPTGPSYYVVNPLLSMGSTSPVPHAIPVSPGDPRLGGRMCMRCGGGGVRPLLLIDVMTCEVCGGVGRVWT